MYKIENVSMYRDAITFTKGLCGNEMYEFIKSYLTEKLQNEEIPVKYQEDKIRSGGLFSGSTVPMLIYTHPTEKYGSFGICVFDRTVYFPMPFISPENVKYNKNKYYKSQHTIGGSISAAITKPNMFKLNQELAWKQRISECFDEMVDECNE